MRSFSLRSIRGHRLFLPLLVVLAGGVALALSARSRPAPLSRPPSDAMASLQFLHQQRAYPDRDIPEDRYERAWRLEQARRALRRPAGAGRAQTIPAWQPLGPKNVGGRTTALAINPLNANILLAGSASGGLWRSDTAGMGVSAWHYIDTGFPVLGVGAIAISAADTGTVYIGTGEVYGLDSSIGGLYIRTTRGSYGIGILKSTDGGQTWSHSLDWSYAQRRGVQVIRIDPNDPDRVFAGTSHGVWRSTDGGGSWTQVLTQSMAVDLVIHPTDSDTLYVSCGNLGVPADAGIWRSFDGGDTWTQLGGGLPATWTGKTLLDLYAAAPNVIYADVANWDNSVDASGVGLYRSVDHGEHWERLTAGFPTYYQIATYQGWFSHFVVVNPADSSQVLVAGVDVWRSTDGGRTFTIQSHWAKWYYGMVPVGGPEGPEDYSHADHHAFARHPALDEVVYLGTDGGVFATSDFGLTFSGRNGGYQTTQFYAGFSSAPGDPTFALGGLQDNSTVVYRGSPAWQRTLGGDGGMTGLDPGNLQRFFASTQYGRVYMTPNSGQNWSRANGEMEEGDDVCFVAPLLQVPGRPDHLWAGRTRVWRSANWGNTWYVPENAPPLDGNPVLALGVSPLDANVIWAATAPSAQRAGVFLSTDQGRNWQNTTGSLPNRYIVDLVPSLRDPSEIFAVLSGFLADHVWRWSGGSPAWQSIGEGLPDVPTSALAIDPLQPDHLYVGNDYGVWFSADAGMTWAAYSEGMPTAALVMDLSISASDHRLRAVTHGLGVWERPLASDYIGTAPAFDSVNLLQNRPNPFNGSTRITYELPESLPVRLELYNVRGQLVRLLVDTVQGPGWFTVTLQDSGLASGIYFYRLVAGNTVQTKRLVLIR